MTLYPKGTYTSIITGLINHETGKVRKQAGASLSGEHDFVMIDISVI
jgi:hypothetical protein